MCRPSCFKTKAWKFSPCRKWVLYLLWFSWIVYGHTNRTFPKQSYNNKCAYYLIICEMIYVNWIHAAEVLAQYYYKSRLILLGVEVQTNWNRNEAKDFDYEFCIILPIGFPEDTGVLTSYQRDLFFSREIIESGDFHRFIDGIIDVSSRWIVQLFNKFDSRFFLR